LTPNQLSPGTLISCVGMRTDRTHNWQVWHTQPPAVVYAPRRSVTAGNQEHTVAVTALRRPRLWRSKRFAGVKITNATLLRFI